MIKVIVHTILGLKTLIGQREVEITAPEETSVDQLLALMVERWGEELAAALFEKGSNRLHSHIRIMVNGRDVGFLKGMETVLGDGDEVLILPPVAGG